MKTSVQNVDLSKFAAEFRRKLVYLQLHAMKSQSNSMKDICTGLILIGRSLEKKISIT